MKKMNNKKLNLFVQAIREHDPEDIKIDSWEAQGFSGNDLFLKVNFSKPLSLSPLEV